MTSGPANSQTNFLSTSEFYPDDISQLLIKLTSLHTDIANAINLREIAQYEERYELITGQQFSSPNDSLTKRYVFRKMFYFGAIDSGSTVYIGHGITGFTTLTHIYGTVITNVGDFRALPFISCTLITDQTSIKVDATNIVITIGTTSPNITSGIVVLEYLYT